MNTLTLMEPFRLEFRDINKPEIMDEDDVEAVQQSKIGSKRKVKRALNPKRSKICDVKSNCGTASILYVQQEKINR